MNNKLKYQPQCCKSVVPSVPFSSCLSDTRESLNCDNLMDGVAGYSIYMNWRLQAVQGAVIVDEC